MASNKPFDYDKPNPTIELLVVTSSTDPVASRIVNQNGRRIDLANQSIKVKSYAELSLPGGYVSSYDTKDIVGLLLDHNIDQVIVIVEEEAGFIRALKNLIENPSSTDPRYINRLVESIKDFARLGLSGEEVKQLSPRSLAHSLASVSAMNIINGFQVNIAELMAQSPSGERNPTAEADLLKSAKVSTYVKTPARKLPDAVIELVSTTDRAKASLSPTSRAKILGR